MLKRSEWAFVHTLHTTKGKALSKEQSEEVSLIQISKSRSAKQECDRTDAAGRSQFYSSTILLQAGIQLVRPAKVAGYRGITDEGFEAILIKGPQDLTHCAAAF
jgi:hypothetical protein